MSLFFADQFSGQYDGFIFAAFGLTFATVLCFAIAIVKTERRRAKILTRLKDMEARKSQSE